MLYTPSDFSGDKEFRRPLSGNHENPPCGNYKSFNPAAVAKRPPSRAILIGEAGANLVLSRLQGWGIPAQMAMAGLAYDLIVDVPSFDLLRFQIKTRSRPRGRRCYFSMKRGFYQSKAGIFAYGRDDYDIAGFVCLETSSMFFSATPKTTFSVKSDWLRTVDIDRDTFDLALQHLRSRRQIEAMSWLASMETDQRGPQICRDKTSYCI